MGDISRRLMQVRALAAGFLAISAARTATAFDAPSRYQELCAGCHGARFSSTGQWLRNGSDADLARVIREGLPQEGMPSFNRGLSEDEIAALVRLVREQAARKPIGVGRTIEAEALNPDRSGGYVIGTSESNPALKSVGYVSRGSHLCYDDVDLTGVRSLELHYAKGEGEPPRRFAVLVFDESGARRNLGEQITALTGGWETYRTRRIGLTGAVNGTRVLCIVGMEGGGVFNLNKFTLSAQSGENDGITETFEVSSEPISAAGHRFELEKVAAASGELWAMDVLGPELIVATQKSGSLWLFKNGQRLGPVRGTPKVWDRGQGGLHSVKAHPQYATNGWIYLSYADPSERGAMTRIVRGRLKGLDWTDEQTIYRAPAELYGDVGRHFGSRLAFDGEDLYFSIGDRGREDRVQDLAYPFGKIHRVRADGTMPHDNPFVNVAGALPSIWSYGHRNPQGLTVHPQRREIWSAEHGPRGGDEVNRIRPALNYGWPLVSFGSNYDGTIISETPYKEGVEAPRHHWTPSIAVSAVHFYTGTRFPKWRDALLVGSLVRQELHLLHIQSSNVVRDEILLQGMGRIRDIVVMDGLIYLVLNHPTGTIYRIVPADRS